MIQRPSDSGSDRGPPPAPAPVPVRLKERVCSFGGAAVTLATASAPMFAIETEPATGTPRASIVLLNSGLVHKVGPFRFGVELARHLARLGYRVLRFDQSGIGESDARADQLSLEGRIVGDVRAAVDFAAARPDAGKIVVVGLCSGAVNAHLATADDERIAGTIMFDGYAYPTLGFQLRYYGERLADPRRVAGFLRRKTQTLVRQRAGWLLLRAARAVEGVPLLRGRIFGEVAEDAAASAAPAAPSAVYLQEFPARARVETDLRKIVGRGTRLLFVYTGGAHAYLNYADQLQDAFPQVPFAGRIDVELLSRADHTFALREDRDELFALVGRWLVERF